MYAKDVGKVLGGLAIGKLEDRFIPVSFNLMGIDIVRLGLGIGQLVAATALEGKVTGIGKDFLDLVGVAGVGLIVEQAAKITLPAKPAAIPTAVAPTAVAPAPVPAAIPEFF
jgi:hypothetical protein